MNKEDKRQKVNGHEKERIVLVIDHEPSTFRAIARMSGDTVDQVEAVTSHIEFNIWLDNHGSANERENKSYCVVFDSRFVDIFQQKLPSWFYSYPRICVSRSSRISHALDSMRLGLSDFLEKPFHLDKMKAAIECAFTDYDLIANHSSSLETVFERLDLLTRRELEICEELSRGLSGKQISSKLGISIKTYYVHRTNLLQKTGARSTIELIRAYDAYSLKPKGAPRSNAPAANEHAPDSIPEYAKAGSSAQTTFPLVSAVAKRNVLQAEGDLSVRAAANLMIERDVSSVVFQKSGKPHLFSMEHMLEISVANGSHEQKLNDLPIEPAATIDKDSNVLDALDKLERGATRYLIAVDPEADDAMLGILTYSDLLAAIDPTLFLEKKNIGQIISRREPLTFSPEWILEDVLCHLVSSEDCIVIVDNGRPVGIITTKDAFRIVSSGQSTAGRLSDYMTHPVRTIPASAAIYDALVHLKRHRIKRAVITDENGCLLGMLTQSEVVGFAYGYWTKLFNHHADELHELVTLITKKATKQDSDIIVDAVSGICDRRHLDELIDVEIERVCRYKTKPFSMLLIGVYRSKRAMEEFSNAFWDEILKTTGHRLTRLVRKNDLAFEWRGEEFAVIAPHTRLSEAIKLASRIQAAIDDFPAHVKAELALSFGIGEYSPKERREGFLSRVGAALQRAETLGGNKIETAPLIAPPRLPVDSLAAQLLAH